MREFYLVREMGQVTLPSLHVRTSTIPKSGLATLKL